MSDSDNHDEGPVEPWVKIQENTFTNWVKDKMRGQEEKYQINDGVRTEFMDGVKLCKLMDVLVGKKIGRRIEKKNMNHYESSGNVTLALQAMHDDGVRLVNIGSEDITQGNRKLILGMLWLLIRRYQIGSETKLPTKQMMLAWVNAVLHPNMQVNNFSTDFNDGKALQGIIEYCRPGTFPQWASVPRGDGLANCQLAMTTAQSTMAIPMVVSPENMASPELDELSGMTYLSYFMSVDSPGYKATLDWVRQTIPGVNVQNFDTDWNNGFAAHQLVAACGGTSRGNTDDWASSCQNAIDESQRSLNVPPILTGKDMANEKVDHIAVMAYAAWHRHAKKSSEPAPIVAPVPVASPPLPPPPADLSGINVDYNNPVKINQPVTIRVITTVVGTEPVQITAHSPSHGIEDPDVYNVGPGENQATLTPSEKGPWKLDIFYGGKAVQAEPFPLMVFDPSLARVEKTTTLIPCNQLAAFEVDYSEVGIDDLTGHVLRTADGTYVQNQIVDSGMGKKTFQFTPDQPGHYICSLFIGGVDIEGSPWSVKVTPTDGGVSVFGQGIENGIQHNENSFFLNTKNNPGGEALVNITAPSGASVMVDMSPGEESREVKYNPTELGIHQIAITYNGESVPNSPFSVNIREPVVYVQNLKPTVTENQPYAFEVDAHECKKGQLCIETGLAVQKYEKIGTNMFAVTFKGLKPGVFDLEIFYKDKKVKDSPFSVKVVPK